MLRAIISVITVGIGLGITAIFGAMAWLSWSWKPKKRKR